MKRPFYFLRRALRSLRGAPVPAAVSAATVAIAIFLFGAFLITARNLYRAAVGQAGTGEAVTVYGRAGLDAAGVGALARRIGAMPEVDGVRTVAPEEGLEELRGLLGEDAVLLDGVAAAEVVPAAFLVRVRPGEDGAAAVQDLARRLGRLDGVESVESEALWLERFSAVVRAGRWIGASWAVLLGAGALLVVSNTARLAALTRREEVEVLRLVGASDSFILRPFLWEGIVQGAAGSLIGLLLLGGAFSLIADALAADPLLSRMLGSGGFLGPVEIVTLAAAGPLVGGLGSLGSAARFLRGVPL